MTTQRAVGSIVSLWRYLVKSMMGEELNATEVATTGLLGDRAYALVDKSDAKVASAKNPRKWPQLFDFRAVLADAPKSVVKAPSVRITLPDGTIVSRDQHDTDQILSNVLKRQVKLESTGRAANRYSRGVLAGYRRLDHRDTVTDFGLPEGTFFDCAVAHLLTTATLDHLRALYPDGRFEVRRFRPNIVVETASGEKDFVENAWIGRTLAIGDAVRLSRALPRCVMTTLSQGDLPKDNGILRTAAQHNRADVGVYASVLRGGRVRRGDSLSLE